MRLASSRSDDDAMAGMYQRDPELALEMINSVLENGDQQEFSIVMRQLAKAFQGSEGAQALHDAPALLFQRFSGRPGRFSIVQEALAAFGLQMPSDSGRRGTLPKQEATA